MKACPLRPTFSLVTLEMKRAIMNGKVCVKVKTGDIDLLSYQKRKQSCTRKKKGTNGKY